jgi:hypothetical protein
MNELELKEYLKNHLKVKVSQSHRGKIVVELLLDDEVITEDSSSMYGSGKCGPM